MTWHRLSLRSLGVIDSAEIEFGDGFTVITGETGAGKTMVVTALGLLRGDRSDSGLVRHGADQARVEAVVTAPDSVASQVQEAGGSLDHGELVLSRSVTASGRSRAHAGGVTVPASLLASVSDEIVAVHGQSDQYRLRSATTQRAALDAFAGAPFAELMQHYGPLHARWRAARLRLDRLQTAATERAREVDGLRRGLAEFAEVVPLPDEDSQLLAEEARLTHAESLVRAAAHAHGALASDDDGSGRPARARSAEALAALDLAAGHDPALDTIADRVRELTVLLDDVAADLSGYAASVEQDPARLAGVHGRRAVLGGLLRKYGPSVTEALAWQEKAMARLAELDDDDSALDRLRSEIAQVEPLVTAAAGELSDARSRAATELSKRVASELTALAMPSARLDVVVEQDARAEPGPYGRDEVSFMFAANSGAPGRPLHRAASGGELSRVMLALEVILADQTSVGTFVFDEVDAGIGGRAAVEVGRRLRQLSRDRQVIAVTHLPQVAAFATAHLRVLKDDDGVVTSSSVVPLDAEARVEELARMLAGQEDSAAAREHARELVARATSSD